MFCKKEGDIQSGEKIGEEAGKAGKLDGIFPSNRQFQIKERILHQSVTKQRRVYIVGAKYRTLVEYLDLK